MSDKNPIDAPPPQSFPQYAAPTGVPIATAQQTKPLMKMMKSLFRGRRIRSPTKRGPRKKVRFY